MFSPRHRSVSVGIVALVASASLALANQPVSAAPQAAARSTQSTTSRAVAHTDQGKLVSKIKGKTANGQRVTGTFTPLHVARKHGDLMVKGLLQGVIHQASGNTTFSALRSVPVKSIAGHHLGRDAAKSAVSDRAACNVLHLVLGPLDLNLLGLTVHLNQVVLDITAVPGAGNLLGNLLCAVAGLLDGTPIAGLLGQIAGLLNQILAALNLGV
ncbi:MAG TPA: hypothetical protein VFV89_00095 [Nocardioides sp.]|uniref:hypothetical protein n=1 Tax=Nocardioides sp. TaxID=35761 RepID=UPI002E365133|nr:hypothetical protein [Nocardioides sp.]HEX5086176.1 hypothetical protein [Nocardioides sp.]